MKRYLALAAVLTGCVQPAVLADLVRNPDTSLRLQKGQTQVYQNPVYNGRVAVMDGRTLWYPQFARRVRLVDIDACELPQWALDPNWIDRQRPKAPSPIPCGPLAKAWLKRTIGNNPVECSVVAIGNDGTPAAHCTSRGQDIALEMLRVGWARVASPNPANNRYLAYQNNAMSARYGMWATYVLDMNEWRRKAVDKTLARQPTADANLLVERASEISPPFVDARRKPRRTDR